MATIAHAIIPIQLKDDVDLSSQIVQGLMETIQQNDWAQKLHIHFECFEPVTFEFCQSLCDETNDTNLEFSFIDHKNEQRLIITRKIPKKEAPNLETHLKLIQVAVDNGPTQKQSSKLMFVVENSTKKEALDSLPSKPIVISKNVDTKSKTAEETPESLFQLGLREEKDRPAEAIPFYEKAVAKNHIQAMVKLGLILKNNIELSSKARAMQLFQQAKEQSPEALKQVGLCYLEGAGVKQSINKALSILNALAPKDPEVARALSLYYVQNDPQKAFPYLKLLPKTDHLDAKILFNACEKYFKSAEELKLTLDATKKAAAGERETTEKDKKSKLVEFTQLKEQNKSLKAQLEKINKQKDKWLADIHSLKEQITELQNEKSGNAGKEQTSKTQVQQLQKEKNDLQTKLKELTQKFNNQSNSLNDSNIARTALQTKLDSQTKSFPELNRDKVSLQSKLDSKTTRVQELELQIQTITRTQQTKEAEAKTAEEQKMKTLKAEFDRLNNIIKELQLKHQAELKTEKERLDKEITELKNKNDAISKTLETFLNKQASGNQKSSNGELNASSIVPNNQYSNSQPPMQNNHFAPNKHAVSNHPSVSIPAVIPVYPLQNIALLNQYNLQFQQPPMPYLPPNPATFHSPVPSQYPHYPVPHYQQHSNGNSNTYG